MPEGATDAPTLGLGSVVGTAGQGFRLDEVIAEDGDAKVYLATALQQSWYGHSPSEMVGDAVFVVVLRPEVVLPPRPDSRTDSKGYTAWGRVLKARLRAVMALVPPDLAGFPNWPRIRRDDAVVIAKDLDAVPPWGVCQISTARRSLAAAMAEARRPHNFTSVVRRTALLAADQRCRRCGSLDRLEVDHVVPVGLGGTNDQANALVLCHSCHLSKTKAERAAFGLNRDEHRENGLTLRESQARSFTPSGFFAELAQRTGWTLGEPAAEGDVP